MGDEIFIFGFSSGGLAALMLTQLIENVGIKKQETFYGNVEKYGQVELCQVWFESLFWGYLEEKKDAHWNLDSFGRSDKNQWPGKVRFLGLFDAVDTKGQVDF